MTNYYIAGMFGIGDSLHQRAIVRHFLTRGKVWLSTPWPEIYHDLPVNLVRSKTGLRTQAKNEAKNQDRYEGYPPIPAGAIILRPWHDPENNRRYGGPLKAMLASAGCPDADTDFSLPVPDAWKPLNEIAKPMMVVKPLTLRKEWGGALTRNPLPEHFLDLYNSIRHLFYTFSVADVAPPHEVFVGEPPEADMRAHKGELDFTMLAGLFSRASLVFTPFSFAPILAQAVGTPVACVFGGHECGAMHPFKLAPWLPIDPINPCACFSHDHACDKRIDMEAAAEKLSEFVYQVLHGRK